MNTQQPMPAELANARPPTRQDAIARIRFRGGLGSRTIEEFADSLRGQQCARSRARPWQLRGGADGGTDPRVDRR